MMSGKLFLKKIILFKIILIGIIVSLIIFNTSVINKEIFKFDNDVNKLILGSSSTKYAINDKIFENSINMSSSADPLFYSYLKMKRMIRVNSNIDTIILEVSPRMISKFIDKRWLLDDTHFSERAGNYFSLMDTEDMKMLKNNFGYDFYKIGLSSVGIRSFRNLKEYFIGDLRGVYGGYEDLHINQLVKALKGLENGEEINVDLSLSKIALTYLDKIIAICKKNEVELIFISTPIRKEFIQKSDTSFMKFNNFYKDRYSDFTYLNFIDFELPDSAYADLFHLNPTGSTIFSQYLQNKGIKNIILESDFSKN